MPPLLILSVGVSRLSLDFLSRLSCIALSLFSLFSLDSRLSLSTLFLLSLSLESLPLVSLSLDSLSLVSLSLVSLSLVSLYRLLGPTTPHPLSAPRTPRSSPRQSAPLNVSLLSLASSSLLLDGAPLLVALCSSSPLLVAGRFTTSTRRAARRPARRRAAHRRPLLRPPPLRRPSTSPRHSSRRSSPRIRPLSPKIFTEAVRSGETPNKSIQIARGALLFLFSFVVFVPSLTTATHA